MTWVAGTPIELTAEDFDPGRVGQIGITIEDGQGNVVVARTTAGIVESATVAGTYTATLPAEVTAPLDGSYLAVWDDGALTANETFVVEAAPDVGDAYATVADVLNRGGALLADVTALTIPSTVQIAGWLTDASAEVNASLAGHGLTTPAVGDAAAALRGCVADYALALALEARYSAGAGTPGSAPLPALEGARARRDACWAALAKGTHPAVTGGIEAAQDDAGAGAGSFWDDEGDEAYRPDGTDGTTWNVNTEPAITKGMPL